MADNAPLKAGQNVFQFNDALAIEYRVLFSVFPCIAPDGRPNYGHGQEVLDAEKVERHVIPNGIVIWSSHEGVKLIDQVGIEFTGLVEAATVAVFVEEYGEPVDLEGNRTRLVGIFDSANSAGEPNLQLGKYHSTRRKLLKFGVGLFEDGTDLRFVEG